MVVAAIYGRRSVDDDPSLSVDNQINRAISLCKAKNWGYIIYRDDGVSGKDTDREGFKQMMRDANKGKFQYLVCYKLDRVSRSVADFSSLLNELQELGVEFISLTENFDTSTPMGRAMMYIAAVFAQLERETIAQRVKDNMIDMAKQGYFTGGPVNFGFDLVTEEMIIRGKVKEVSRLVENEQEKQHVIDFYDWYNEPQGSVRNNCIIANKSGISTKSGKLWNPNQMARLLSNALYCIADEDAYNYFKNETNVKIVSDKKDFNGINGLMYYNRRIPHKKTTRLRDEDEWILAVGQHKGFIPGKIWAETQRKLKKNASTPPRAGTATKGLLAYLVKCGHCGGSMSYYPSWKTVDGIEYGYYRCRRRETQGKHLCDQPNMNSYVLETTVINHIKKSLSDISFVEKAIKQARKEMLSQKAPSEKELRRIEKEIEANNTEMKNLIIALGRKTIPEELIENRIKELQEQIAELKQEMMEIKSTIDFIGSVDDINIVYHFINEFNNSFDEMDFEEKRLFLRYLIKEIVVTDYEVHIYMFFLPGIKDDLVFSSRTDKDSSPQLT